MRPDESGVDDRYRFINLVHRELTGHAILSLSGEISLVRTPYSLLEALVSKVSSDTDTGLSDQVRTLSTESDWTSDHTRAVRIDVKLNADNEIGSAGSEGLDGIVVDIIKPQAHRFVFPPVTAYPYPLQPYKNAVYLFPNGLDEKVAKIHVLVNKTHRSLWASRLKARARVSTTVIEPSVVSEIDILVSSMAHFNISASDHMKKWKNVPSIGIQRDDVLG